MRCTDCTTKVQPVVGLDIDGTLGQYHQHFMDFLRLYRGTGWPVEGPHSWDGIGEFNDFLGLTKAEYREAKLAYRQGGWKRWMPVYPGAPELVASLHRADVEVWLLTTRPWMRLDNIDPDTREWCRRTRIEFDYMLFGEDKYEQFVSRVEPSRVVAVVDDDGQQLTKAAFLGLPWIWRRHSFNTGTMCTPLVDDLDDLATVLHGRVLEWRQRNG